MSGGCEYSRFESASSETGLHEFHQSTNKSLITAHVAPNLLSAQLGYEVRSLTSLLRRALHPSSGNLSQSQQSMGNSDVERYSWSRPARFG